MKVRLGDVTFSDWISLKYEGGYTDTFIFDIDALNGLPPFDFHPLLQRLVAELDKKRPGASLWIRVTSPGEWYLMEVKRSMTSGFSIPYVVTSKDKTPDYRSFSFGPRLFSSSLHHPPKVDDEFSSFSREELKCLQVLARSRKGIEEEIASLAGLPETVTNDVLQNLQKSKMVVFKLGEQFQKDKSKPKKMDPYWMWHPTRKGVSVALRSWGASNGVDFSGVKELNPHLIGTSHRTNSRRWTAWLRSAYPQVEIWTGWTEVQLPEIFVRPDALAWGRIQGFETLFWLEIGDEHKKRKQIEKITRIRLASALKFCQETGARLVYTQISPPWVQDSVRWACNQLAQDTAVIIGNVRKFGKLPVIEWGKFNDVV
ncbi:MAG: hypothetical protein QY332_21815 [Anaerolineales bacterium]|nr:hypothetical protein [Chloroflexota bacterium]WKZ36249.1 MAG: hypothetical protein QY332_21815 [Anaerolineales bacterium]